MGWVFPTRPSIGGQGRGVDNPFLPGEHKTTGRCGLSDGPGGLKLLVLSATCSF